MTGVPPTRRALQECRRLLRRTRSFYGLLGRALQRTVFSTVAHGCLNLAQSAAYSSIVALFPALIIITALIGLLPDTAPIRFQLAAFFDRVLPPVVSPLLDAAFQSTPEHAHSLRALASAGFVSFLGAANIISTLMEGLRRARNLPTNAWSFWQRRRRTFELVPLSIVPLAVASLLVMFGHVATQWLVMSVGTELRTIIIASAIIIRWAISFAASVGLIGLIYHLGVPDGIMPISLPHGIPAAMPGPFASARRRSRALLRAASRSTIGSALITPSYAGEPGGEIPLVLPPRSWRTVLPGAVMATAMWFLTTLAFGWYVTRFANYSEVYGSLGAAIALLFWLYIVSLSVLCGAEFNAQLDLLSIARLTQLAVPLAKSRIDDTVEQTPPPPA